MFINKSKNNQIRGPFHIFFFIMVSFLFISVLFPKNKINFSATILETIVEGNEEKQIFKDDVIIKKNNILLLTNEAVYYPAKNQVILINNVKMYDGGDSLFCDSLILYDTKNTSFKAINNVNFFQSDHSINCNKLEYNILDDTTKKILKLYDNVEILDSLRIVRGDSINILYTDSLINHIDIFSNGEIINYKPVKIKNSKKTYLIEDYISSKRIFMDFLNGDSININLYGMAVTKLNIVRDSLLEGISNTTGDSIIINMKNEAIQRMQIIGGAEGKFVPEKYNSKVDTTITYNAEYIDYLVMEERSILYDNAYLNYDFTELNAGKIFVDWKENRLKAKMENLIYPSINGFGEHPTFGDSMIFNLTTKRGKIYNAKTEYNEIYYNGKNIIRDNNSILYVKDSHFTTCSDSTPHYLFQSDYMKIIPNDRIIAKPVIFHIQGLPIFYLPFAVFPNKNGNRISGWIMPAFGHRKSTGTYIEDLGYYYVPNDYSDYRILLDIQDRRGLISNQLFRYKSQTGKKWYNYFLDGNLQIEKKYYLPDEEDDITNLFDEDTSIYDYVKWQHKQSFDPTQDLIINYKYKSNLDPLELNFNERLDQNQLTSLSYQKRWERNSMSIGFEKYKELNIQNPNELEQINVYKWLSGPRISFSLPQRKIFPKSGKWFNNIYVNYGFSYNAGRETYTKESCIDNNLDGICDLSNDECLEFDSDGNCLNYIWDEDVVDISSGGAKNNLQFTSTHLLGWATLSPRLSIRDDWVFNYRDYNQEGNYEELSGFKRRVTWNSSLTLNTKLYGIIPINIGNLNTIRHKMTPSMTLTYTPDLITNSNQIIYDNDILTGTSATGLTVGSRNLRFSLDNNFQMKVNDKNNQINKIDLLNYYMTLNYSGTAGTPNIFSLIDSRLSFKKPNGGELLYIHMQHDLYERDINDNIVLDASSNPSFNSYPKLKTLMAQMSTSFRLNGNSIGTQIESNDFNSVSKDTIDTSTYNSILYMDDQKPIIGTSEFWRSDLNFSIQGEYNIDEQGWDFNYFNLDTRSTIHLSKKWLLTYAFGVNLMDMKIRSQSLKLYRDLHCWEFMFTWWPTGYTKGFQLSINIKHPDLKDVRLRSSSSNRKFITN